MIAQSLSRWIGRPALVLGLICSAQAMAQPVYRCEHQGKVQYSHEPCLGATVVDTTPTQGMDKFTGVSKKSQEVRSEELNRTIGNALMPLTGRTPEERALQIRRYKLAPQVQRECRLLDDQMPEQEEAARTSAPDIKGEAEAKLFLSRSRYRNLGC